MTGWGVSPSDGNEGVEGRAEECRCGLMKGADAKGGLNRSWEGTLWCGKHLS